MAMPAQAIWDLEGYEVPAGMVYEWKVVEVLGEPLKTDQYREAGWADVPVSRHSGPVVFGGCRLMERPSDVHQERIAKGYEKAQAQRLEMAVLGVGGVASEAPYILTDHGWMPTLVVRELEALHEHAKELCSVLKVIIGDGE